MSMIEVGQILRDSTTESFTWRVEDFFSHPQDQDDYYIQSPSFSALGAQWRILFIDSSVSVDGFSCTRLKLCVSPPSDAHFEFGIHGRDDAELIAYSGETRARADCVIVGLLELPADWRQKKDEFAPGGFLSVFCRLRVTGAPRCPSATPGALKVVENLKELLSTEEAYDITLKVQNQEFKAHKALLVARSSVFRAMFSHKMSEKLSNEVNITDCDPDAFRIFLRHAYTGDAEGLSVSNAFNVFFVANKYDDAELKIQCKDCIASNITVENVCDVIAFSLLHSDSFLLEIVSQFFTKHFRQILLTNKWQCFFREHATAANELLIRVSNLYVPPQ